MRAALLIHLQLIEMQSAVFWYITISRYALPADCGIVADSLRSLRGYVNDGCDSVNDFFSLVFRFGARARDLYVV